MFLKFFLCKSSTIHKSTKFMTDSHFNWIYLQIKLFRHKLFSFTRFKYNTLFKKYVYQTIQTYFYWLLKLYLSNTNFLSKSHRGDNLLHIYTYMWVHV